MQSQAAWWIRQIHLKSCFNDPIPLAKHILPMPMLHIYPDAAGSNPDKPKLGCGAFIDIPSPVLFYMMWPKSIRFNKNTGHGNIGLKLSFLEGIAALCGVIAEPKLLFNKVVMIHSDNLGLVLAFRKGHSRCLLTYSVILSLKKLETAFGMKLIIVKTPRCGSPQAEVADWLSKGQLQKVWKFFPHRRSEMGAHSSSLMHWLKNPTPTRVLGSAIIKELSEKYTLADMEFEWEDEVNPMIHHNFVL